MFDSLRKKLKKTIKDASESIPEEELEPSQISKELDDLEADLQSIEEKYSDNTDEEEDTEEVSTTENVVEEENVEEESSEDETEEEVKTPDEVEEETIEESQEEPEELVEDETDEEIVEESADEVQEEAPEEKKKGFFGFLKRDKNKKEEHTFETEEIVEEETIEESEEVVEEKVPETEKTEEESSEEVQEKSKEEDKGRFGFLRRDKKKETSDEKEDVKDSKKEEKAVKYEDEETGGKFSFITKKTIKEEDIEEILEELEFSLIEGDVAFDVAERIVESVKEDLVGRKIKRRGDMELFTTNALKKAITEIIDNGSYDLLGDIEASKQKGEPYKIMFVGINGTGKTTTIAKMATYLEKHGYSSVFGASDTFRAGAIEQLEHHANNLNLKIIKHERNSDPAAVAYDAVEHARATGKDVVLIDTSGRMQTNANLMDEMKKIKRVSKPDIVLYVGDALMGNDATEQATKFNEVIDIDGIILTKADADAKGGAAISIGHVINKPILFIGTGQSYEDLMEFKPEWMIDQIFAEEAEA
ncbi:MAG: signal recognition particle-docking protein FtsY [Methanosphaera sp.]|nr:signal recognition particle-docking protein FtsY [Methanosphaera sp.]MEE1117264.1 signal recognition particle-docking protein FtsY [Methanosphaera sp.]